MYGDGKINRYFSVEICVLWYPKLNKFRKKSIYMSVCSKPAFTSLTTELILKTFAVNLHFGSKYWCENAF